MPGMTQIQSVFIRVHPCLSVAFTGAYAWRSSVAPIRIRAALPVPDDQIRGRRLAAQFAEDHGVLAAVVVAVHRHLRERAFHRQLAAAGEPAHEARLRTTF